MVKPYVRDLKDDAKSNEFFRHVVFTGAHLQLVLMSLAPGEEIGEEVHEVDQLLTVVKGEGKAVVAGDEYEFKKGMVACVPAGVVHNVINTEDEPMKLFTVYAPPQHKADTVQEVKPEVAEPVSTGR